MPAGRQASRPTHNRTKTPQRPPQGDHPTATTAGALRRQPQSPGRPGRRGSSWHGMAGRAHLAYDWRQCTLEKLPTKHTGAYGARRSHQELDMRFALLPLFAILIAGMISCSNADEQIAEIQCPGATEGEFITVTVPPPEADDTGWTHPDELLRYKAAILFYQDMEELRCPASRMQHRDSATESSMELLTEAATICDLTIDEIIRRINNEAEARRAATDPETYTFEMRLDILYTAVEYPELCPWYEK